MLVGRLVEHAQCGAHRFLSWLAGDRTQGCKSRTRMFVGDVLGQARLGVGDTIRPLVEHLNGGGSHPGILGREQFVEQRIVNQI